MDEAHAALQLRSADGGAQHHNRLDHALLICETHAKAVVGAIIPAPTPFTRFLPTEGRKKGPPVI